MWMPGPFSPTPIATSTSVLARPPSENSVSMLTTRRRTRGMSIASRATIGGSDTTWPASATASVSSRSAVAGSKSPPSTVRSRSRSARARPGASAAARGVGTMPRPLRLISGSSSVARRRASALLTADGVTCSRRAARATLRSASTVSSTSSRFRSSDDRLTDGDDTHHESSLVENYVGA